MDVTEQEEAEGVRFVWNVWPCSRVDAAKLVVPLAVAVTPLRRLPNMPLVDYDPVMCSSCPAVLSPYARVDYQSFMWLCPLCHERNRFPPSYQGISPEAQPAELYPTHTALEYRLPSHAPPGTVPPRCPPAFLFVLDTALSPEEVVGLRAAVQQALSLMPDAALVGVITFGATVQVHELGHEDMAKAFCLRGDRALDAEELAVQLKLGAAARLRMGGRSGPGAAAAGTLPPPPPSGRLPPLQPPLSPTAARGNYPHSSRGGTPTYAGACSPTFAGGVNGDGGGGGGSACGGRFLVPLSAAGLALDAVMDSLQPDAELRPGQRPARATGPAVAAAVHLLAACVPGTGGRALLLTGGPATVGPGRVVSRDQGDSIRTHKDCEKGEARLFHKAAKFYEGLGERLAATGHTLDVFAAALDQVGLAELRAAVSDSGGVMILGETFDHATLRSSLGRVLATGPDGHPDCGYNATVEVIAPKEIAVAGAIGSVSGVKRETKRTVTEVAVGEGGTTAWRACCLNPGSTITLFFDVATSHATPAPGGEVFVMQFTTRYVHPDGSTRLRVITSARRWVSGGDTELADAFDQGAATAAVARLAAFKAASEESIDVVRWLDRSVIALCKRFGSWQSNDPSSFQLPDTFQLFPQFLFHLRRSQFLQVFNNTPDETAFYRLWLERETTANALTMVQPALLSFTIGEPPVPVALDVSSIQGERALVLDTFFMVLLFHGVTVAAWAAAGYQHLPEHAAFAEMLSAAEAYAEGAAEGRLPAAPIVRTKQGGSQARFLLAKLNPSATHDNATGLSEEVIFTDDVSLSVFLEHLAKVVTA